MKMTIEQKRVIAVLETMLGQVKEDPDFAEMYSDSLEDMLDDIAKQEGFGTEQSVDPRGDFRNGEWSMDCVEKIDG